MKNKFIYFGVIAILAWGTSLIVLSSKEHDKRMVNCEVVTKVLKNGSEPESSIAIMKDGDANLVMLAACGGYHSGSQRSSFNPTTGHH